MDVNTVLRELETFAEECRKPRAEEKEKCGIEMFTLLLSGISSCRRIPGIDHHMGYQGLYRCQDEASENQVKQHLQRMYGVSDRESLDAVCGRMFRASEEYAQFWGFWHDEPPFDLNELNEGGRAAFQKCIDFAEQIQPIAGSRGFYAWDYNERIGLYRLAAACGIVEEREFWQVCVPMAKQMSAVYDSFGDFAVGCLCGAVYFMYCENAWNDEGLYGFFDINRRILTNLLSEEGEWSRYEWFRAPQKQYAKTADEIQHLLKDWEEAEGCFATDRITVDGCRVGYMYREEPNPDMPDSGWRFFAGDESDEYANNVDHVGIFTLNTLCNYDPDILSFLHAPYGTAYFRDENGVFCEEALVVPE